MQLKGSYSAANAPEMYQKLSASTELNPSREPVSRADTQHVHNISWNPSVHYRAHEVPPLVPSRSETRPSSTSLLTHRNKL
jgi:hypothetical protein